MAKTIHQLELHEYLEISISGDNNFLITRVSGGWLYTRFYRWSSTRTETTTFVPYNKEFMKDGDVVIPAFDENKQI